jgi:hypothetical protein
LLAGWLSRYYSVLSNPYFALICLPVYIDLICPYFQQITFLLVLILSNIRTRGCMTVNSECPYIRKNNGSIWQTCRRTSSRRCERAGCASLAGPHAECQHSACSACPHRQAHMYKSRSFGPYFDLNLSLMCPCTFLGVLTDPYISLIQGSVDKYVSLFLFRGINMPWCPYLWLILSYLRLCLNNFCPYMRTNMETISKIKDKMAWIYSVSSFKDRYGNARPMMVLAKESWGVWLMCSLP